MQNCCCFYCKKEFKINELYPCIGCDNPICSDCRISCLNSIFCVFYTCLNCCLSCSNCGKKIEFCSECSPKKIGNCQDTNLNFCSSCEFTCDICFKNFSIGALLRTRSCKSKTYYICFKCDDNCYECGSLICPCSCDSVRCSICNTFLCIGCPIPCDFCPKENWNKKFCSEDIHDIEVFFHYQDVYGKEKIENKQKDICEKCMVDNNVDKNDRVLHLYDKNSVGPSKSPDLVDNDDNSPKIKKKRKIKK